MMSLERGGWYYTFYDGQECKSASNFNIPLTNLPVEIKTATVSTSNILPVTFSGLVNLHGCNLSFLDFYFNVCCGLFSGL